MIQRKFKGLKSITEITNPLLIQELQTFPNQAAIFSIINGPNRGQFWEFPRGKAVILIENSANPFVFITGQLNPSDISIISEICPRDPLLYCNPAHHKWFLNNRWQMNLRIQLNYQDATVIPITKGWSIKPIDNLEFFKQCYKFHSMIDRFASFENFFKFCKGYAFCNKNEIVSEIYSAYCGKDVTDISIYTHINYLAQGGATQISSYFARKCLEQNINLI